MSPQSATQLVVDSTSEWTLIDGKKINLPAYFTVVALSILIWEIVSRSRKDIQVLRAVHGQVFQNYVYLLSRFVTIAYLVVETIFQTAPLGRCSDALKATSALYILSVLFTLLLFYHRLRSVFQEDRYMGTVFGLLCLCVVGGCATLFPGVSVLNMGPGLMYCSISPPTELYVAAFLIGPLLYTSIVFIFVAARQVEGCEIDFTAKKGLREFISRDCRTVLSRGFIEEGQGYYLSTVLFQLMSLVLFLLGPSLTARTILVPLNLSIINIAACRVYVSSQERRVQDEKARKAKLMLTLTAGQDSRIVYNLGGIKVTKTVEQFSV